MSCLSLDHFVLKRLNTNATTAYHHPSVFPLWSKHVLDTLNCSFCIRPEEEVDFHRNEETSLYPQPGGSRWIVPCTWLDTTIRHLENAGCYSDASLCLWEWGPRWPGNIMAGTSAPLAWHKDWSSVATCNLWGFIKSPVLVTAFSVLSPWSQN